MEMGILKLEVTVCEAGWECMEKDLRMIVEAKYYYLHMFLCASQER